MVVGAYVHPTLVGADRDLGLAHAALGRVAEGAAIVADVVVAARRVHRVRLPLVTPCTQGRSDAGSAPGMVKAL